MTTAQEREDLRKLAEAASALDHNERMNWYSYEELIDAAMQREIDDLRTALAKAERTLTLAGYTDEHGAELWKPPLGPSAAPLLDKIDELQAKLTALEGQEPAAWVEVVDTYEGPYNFNGMELLSKGKHMLYAAAGAAPVPEGWQPIETAPKAGRSLILLLTPSSFPQVAYSNTWWVSGFSVENKPTHWMPLPAAPRSES